jgi:hypothetical protein
MPTNPRRWESQRHPQRNQALLIEPTARNPIGGAGPIAVDRLPIGVIRSEAEGLDEIRVSDEKLLSVSEQIVAGPSASYLVEMTASFVIVRKPDVQSFSDRPRVIQQRSKIRFSHVPLEDPPRVRPRRKPVFAGDHEQAVCVEQPRGGYRERVVVGGRELGKGTQPPSSFRTSGCNTAVKDLRARLQLSNRIHHGTHPLDSAKPAPLGLRKVTFRLVSPRRRAVQGEGFFSAGGRPYGSLPARVTRFKADARLDDSKRGHRAISATAARAPESARAMLRVPLRSTRWAKTSLRLIVQWRMTWTRLLSLLGMVAVLGSCGRRNHTAPAATVSEGGASVAPPLPPARPELTLLYSSDLRGRLSPDTADASGGLARRATLVDRVKLEGGVVVQVDAGDLLAGSADVAIPGASYGRDVRTHMVLASYDRLGLDVVTLGERDLEMGRDRLKAALRAAEISVVAANLFGKADERPFPADQLIETGGQSIGVFGILDMPPEQAADLQPLGFRLGDAGEAAIAEVQSLRSRGARLVVGLFHIVGGRARAEQILARATGIDVVVLGHAGDDASAGFATVVGRTQVLFAGTLGTALGRLDVRGFRPGSQPKFEDHTLKLTGAIPDQVGVGSIERAAAATLRQKSGQKEPLVPINWTYASNEGCEMCHKAEVEQWNTTAHAQAFAALKKFRRDRDTECLGCHMTGYLQAGQTTNAELTTKYFSNVGCESCHGPSAAHVRATNKKSGTSRTVGPEVCMGCHTNDQSLVSFDYASALPSILGPGHAALAADSSHGDRPERAR